VARFYQFTSSFSQVDYRLAIVRNSNSAFATTPTYKTLKTKSIDHQDIRKGRSRNIRFTESRIKISKPWSSPSHNKTSELARESLKASGSRSLNQRIRLWLAMTTFPLVQESRSANVHNAGCIQGNNIDRTKKKSYTFHLQIYCLLP